MNPETTQYPLCTHVALDLDLKWVPASRIDPNLFRLRQIVLPRGFDTGAAVFVGAPGPLYHTNYMDYLTACWAHHWSPVVTPDILWFTCLNEIAGVVRENPEELRHLFTSSAGKTEIIVSSAQSATVLPLGEVIAHLRQVVPAGIDPFLPTFTTSTIESTAAFAAAFCDTVSPYYSYSMLLCGFPSVVIKGTPADYQKLKEHWRTLPVDLCRAMGTYYASVLDLLSDIAGQVNFFYRRDVQPVDAISSRASVHFWRQMFRLDQCGSGHQAEVGGWFSQLFRTTPEVRYPCNYDTHVARVNYKNLDTGKSYSMFQGVFSSSINETMRVAEPQFGSIVIEQPEE